MTEVRIRTRLDSTTPHLPELAPLVGHEVEIVVTGRYAPTPPDPLPPADLDPPPPGVDPDYWEGVRRLRADARAALAANPIVFPGPAEWAAAEQAIRELNESGFDWDVYRRMHEDEERFAAEDLRAWQERQKEGGPS